jgi:hypothetical protein
MTGEIRIVYEQDVALPLVSGESGGVKKDY